MKVLLLSIFQENMGVTEELGLEYIAAALRKNDHSVEILTMAESEFCLDDVIKYEPEIIGFNTYWNTLECTNHVACRIKQSSLACYILYGGYQASYHFDEILSNDYVDFIIPFEGEMVFLDLVNALTNNEDIGNVRGIVFRRNNQVIKTQTADTLNDLDSLPFPARDLLVRYNFPYATISTSRGCMRKCSFCMSHSYWKRWRGRSPGNIVDEIEYVQSTYKFDRFSFIDASFEDSFTKGRYLEIAQEILRRNLRIYYHVNLRAEFCKNIPTEDMNILVESGLISVYLGIESANRDDLLLYNKYAKTEDNYAAMRLLSNFPISIHIGFINFNPQSTFISLRDNCSFFREFGVFNAFLYNTNLILFQGTDIAKIFDKACEDEIEFTNSNINNLYGFINETFNKKLIFNNRGVYDNFIEYFAGYTCELIVQARSANSTEYLEIIKAAQYRLEAIFHDLNKHSGNFYERLLDLAENGWDEQKANIYQEKYLSWDYVNNVLKRLDLEKNRFLRDRIKIGGTI